MNLHLLCSDCYKIFLPLKKRQKQHLINLLASCECNGRLISVVIFRAWFVRYSQNVHTGISCNFNYDSLNHL